MTEPPDDDLGFEDVVGTVRGWAGRTVAVSIWGLATHHLMSPTIVELRGTLELVETAWPGAAGFKVGDAGLAFSRREFAGACWQDFGAHQGQQRRILRVTQNGVAIAIDPDPLRR